MKKYIYMIIASVLLLSVGGCRKAPVDTPDTPQEDTSFRGMIIGQWHCISSDLVTEIYVEFFTDDTFRLYQKVGESAYNLYIGTWSVDEETHVISGEYNDGNPWAASYTILYADKSMTWTSNDEYGTEDVYDKCEIPQSVKDACIPVVRSAGTERKAFL